MPSPSKSQFGMQSDSYFPPGRQAPAVVRWGEPEPALLMQRVDATLHRYEL